MRNFGAKFISTLLLLPLLAMQVGPIAAAFFLKLSGVCDQGCEGSCYCIAQGEVCRCASPTSTMPGWKNCKSKHSALIPNATDWFCQWANGLAEPEFVEYPFFILNSSQLISLLLPPPDGPPWRC